MTIQEIYLNNKENILFSNNDKVVSFREKILNQFNKDYFNKKNNESIKNIDLNFINNLQYNYKKNNILSNISNIDEKIYNLNIVNGFLNNYDDEKLKINPINLENFKNNLKHENDFIIDLNTLLANSGYEITIKKNQNIIINLNNTFSNNDITVFQKNLIKCEAGSRVTLIDNYESDLCYFHNIIVSIDLDSSSNFEHIITQKNGKNNNLFLSTFTDCKKNSKYSQSIFNFSDGFVRNHHYTNLVQSGSEVNYDGTFFLKNSNLCENKTSVRHISENCKSDQNYKGVLNDNSKGIYNSFTIVEKKAQKTEGYQLSKGILLSSNSTFFSKPELRIYADDVKCSHGSTIGPIDDQIIFYIRSRGINKKEAINILVKSFIEDNVEKINNYIVQKKLQTHINNYLLLVA